MQKYVAVVKNSVICPLVCLTRWVPINIPAIWQNYFSVESDFFYFILHYDDKSTLVEVIVCHRNDTFESLSPAHYQLAHDDVIKWKFPRYWPFVRGIHRSRVNYPHKGQWRGALMFSLICAWINGGVNNCEAGDLRRHRGHYDVTVMWHEGD